ncbi:MAG: putative kinase [Candidatus Azotimanducaceae bacterium]|jgi:predicted kinase
MGLWLKTPIGVLKKRTDQRHYDASDADVQVLQIRLLKAPGFLDWVHVAVSGSLAQTIKFVSLAIA